MFVFTLPEQPLFNEAYCRDISIKIRSQLEIKRRRGDFIGSFAVYGYKKDPDNKHQLLVDEYAADVVRDIFRWKLEGMSVLDIADRLNVAGTLTPMDYKKAQGMAFSTPFRVYEESVWSAVTVLRILKNPVYIGTLEQGRVTTPSYKVKRLVQKPREEWAVVEGRHEAIIDPYDFETVQKVLALDTRTSISGKAVEWFSGLVYCGECGGAMIRKTVPSGKKKYVYYVCAAHKEKKTCSSHSLRDIALNEIVLDALKQHIQDVINLSDLLDMTDTAALQQAGMRKLQARLEQKQEEIERYQMLLHSLYESLTDGIIDREEYLEFKHNYTRRRDEAAQQAEALQDDLSRGLEEITQGQSWLHQFRKHQNITQLERSIVVSLIERILIYQGHRVEIVYRWQDEFSHQMELLLQAQKLEKAVD